MALDPRDHTALANLGQALADTGQFDEAIVRLRAALAQAPMIRSRLNNLGVAFIHAGRYAEAIEPLERAVQVRPRFAMAHNNLGGLLFRRRQNDRGNRSIPAGFAARSQFSHGAREFCHTCTVDQYAIIGRSARTYRTMNPRPWIVAVVLAISIGAVYGRALNVPFIYDDGVTIVQNTSIQSLWPIIGTQGHPGPLNPVPDLPTSGRPLHNLSFAINYAFGGLNPFGYHAVNVAIHFLSSLLVWAIVRRTLQLPYFADRFATSAGMAGGMAVAMLWALHPLQTEAVIYATQRHRTDDGPLLPRHALLQPAILGDISPCF